MVSIFIKVQSKYVFPMLGDFNLRCSGVKPQQSINQSFTKLALQIKVSFDFFFTLVFLLKNRFKPLYTNVRPAWWHPGSKLLILNVFCLQVLLFYLELPKYLVLKLLMNGYSRNVQ